MRPNSENVGAVLTEKSVKNCDGNRANFSTRLFKNMKNKKTSVFFLYEVVH